MKKITALLSAVFLLCMNIYASEIFTTTETFTIADGITLTNVKSFYSDHNLTYSYIKADLSNENVGLRLLTPQSGPDTLDTVGNIAAANPDTVAAMNADFFSTVSGGKALSLGIEIKNGELIQSPINPDTMATIYEKDSVVDMTYLGFNIMVVAPNWEYAPIAHLNKHTSYYGSILMYTKEFNGGYSPAPGGEVVEVVVEDGVVTEFRRNMPPCKIPENGCVLVVSEGSSMFFANNFAVGDPIKFDYYVTPDILSSDTAFGGGAMLVSEGKALTNFSHVISGYNPRSAIGIDKSGKTVYLVAVNGRSSESRGMTMSELANLMADLGCYKAVNLDGGGSTNMVASTIWQEKLHTVNKPSENRKVVNAVGFSYTAQPSEPYGIELKSERDSVFIGQALNVSAAVYDKNKRPISGEVSWSCDGGSMTNGVFTGTRGGTATVYASCENASGSLEIYVIDRIAGIKAPSSFVMSVGESQKLELTVFDSYGHTDTVSNYAPFTISSADPDVAYVKDGILYAVGNGSTVLSIAKDNTVAYIAVAVGSEPYDYYDDFESLTGEFSSYPAYVGGDYSSSDEYYRSGSASGRLYYDFTAQTDDTKAAYYTLSEPVTLDNSENKISLYIKTDESFSHSLKAQFKDKNGSALRLTLKPSENGEEFSLYTADIPDSAERPLTLTKIYVASLAGEICDEGYVYFDDLKFKAVKTPSLPYAPQNLYDDPMCSSSGSAVFRVGAAETSGTLLSKLSRENMINALKGSDKFAVFGVNDSSAVNRRSEFYKHEDENALYLSVNAGTEGIRKASSSQWDLIMNAINNTDKKNIFILSENPIFSSDSFENETIKNIFSSLYENAGKNIFVISKGSENSLYIMDNVRYFTLRDIGKNMPLSEKIQNYSYLEFSFDGEVSYRWKTLWQ